MRLADAIEAFRPADRPPPRTLGAFFLWALRGAWPVLFGAALISALAGTLETMSAYVLGKVVDAAVSSTAEAVWQDNVGLFVFAVVFFLLLRPVIFGSSGLVQSVIVQPNINVLVLSRLHRWSMGQDVTYFDNDFAGRIAQKQLQCARALTDVVNETINAIVFVIASFAVSIVLLVSIGFQVALALVLWCAVYLAAIRWFLPRIRKRAMARAAARAMVTGQVVDTITNIKTVKLFAHQDFEDQAALGAMGSFRDRAVEQGTLAGMFRLTIMVIAGVLPVVLLGGSIWLWSRGVASTGDIVAAGTVGVRIGQMTNWFGWTLMGIYSSIGEVEDGMHTLTPPHRLVDDPAAAALGQGAPEIRYEDVSFAYGREVGGVTNISLTVRPGEKLGIVGASGAGKSTLVALLLRLYDTEGGRILVAGEDVRDVTQNSLRARIGMVTQETAMFNRSARDNVAYGRPDASDEEVIEAARRAEAHEFILGLVDHVGRKGYDAHLGERGVKLSGGQRQRIALARAILKDAPILVLDEATSALDSEVEAQIQAALSEVMEGKTVVAIAHRLSTIARMDRIVVLEEGRIVEEGTHAELIALGGRYAAFWNRQSGGFLGLADAAE